MTNQMLNMINPDRPLADDLKSINDAFDISLKAKDLYDAGLLDTGMSIMNQAAELGESMWKEVLDNVKKNFPDDKGTSIDRGTHVVAK